MMGAWQGCTTGALTDRYPLKYVLSTSSIDRYPPIHGQRLRKKNNGKKYPITGV